MEKTIIVEGMMCPHCEARVKKALETLDFIREAAPDHEKNRVVLTLDGDFREEPVKKLIEDNDYTYKGEE